MVIAESDLGVSQLSFLPVNCSPKELLKSIFPDAVFISELGKYGAMVKAYFATWEVPKKQIVLDLKGTPFQINVWKALLTIPSAQYLAYNDVAGVIGNPKAVRAVGTAIGSNPVAYLIPCHRVIKESGKLGEYGWGKEKKPLINGFENIKLSNKRIV